MVRVLSVCALVLALPLVCRADDKPEPTETVIKLTVEPAPAPKPALRYQLLPELREMNPGNAVQGYLLCFMEQNHFFIDKEAVEDREKWQTMPLKELPLKDMGYRKSSPLFRQVDYAARLETVDWQTLPKLKSQGVKLLIPEVGQLRMLMGALKVRFRVEVAERHFDDALITAKTMFALARHLGEHPTVIGNLVGFACAYVAIGPLEEMLEQPGCPNLFWALTDLPKPLINCRNGWQGERLFLANVFAVLDDRAPMTEAQLKITVDRVQEILRDINDPDAKKDVGEWRGGRLKDETYLAGARQRLIEFGLPPERVKQFPALQVLLLDSKIDYEMRRDDVQKLMSLPYWQAEPFLMDSGKPRHDAEEKSLFMGLTPGFRKVRQAQARLEQRLALLTCVEGLRMHAADHNGKLPTQLADVKLPLPVDPITGKPFVYKLDGATATLQGSPPKGLENTAAYNVRYEVTIKK